MIYQFIIILDEINGIRYSQNELDNGNLTAIQLVNYLRISYLQKNFHTLLFSLGGADIFLDQLSFYIRYIMHLIDPSSVGIESDSFHRVRA